MAGRVIPIVSPLRLDLADLLAATDEVIVLARSVDLGSASQVTLRVAVQKVALRLTGVPGFIIEARPVFIDPGGEADIVGDIVAAVAIDDTAKGTLLLAAFTNGFAGPVQISIRCGHPSAGVMELRAHVDLVCKWREDQRLAVRRAMRPLARLRRSKSVIPLAAVLGDDTLVALAPSLASVARLRGRIADAIRASTTGVSRRGACRTPACVFGPPRRSPSWTSGAGAASRIDPLSFPTEIEIVAVSRGSRRVVRGPFRTRGRCIPLAGGAIAEEDSTACRCGMHHAKATPATQSSVFDVAIAESLGTSPPRADGSPLRRAVVFLDEAMPWVGGRVELPSVGAALDVVPVALSGLEPGIYDLELSLVTGECRGRVRSGGFIVLDSLAEPNTSTVVGPVSLDGLVHGTMHPSALLPEVEIRGRLFLPAQGGTIRPGPIVIVGHGVVYGCLPGPSLTSAVLGVTPLLQRLAANGFVAAAVEGVATAAPALAALGLLRWLELPIEHPLELGQLPADCALVGHSQAATAYPAVASYINHVAGGSEAVDYYLNPIVAPDDVGDDLEVPPLVEFPRAIAVSVVSFAPPITPLGDLDDAELEADFGYWLVISGTHDGDVIGSNALQVFDRFGSRAPAKPPAIQASVRVRRLNHGSWFDPDEVGILACDKGAKGEVMELVQALGNELNERLTTMWLLGAMFRSRQRAFFEIRNLVGVAEGDVLENADQVQWRFTILPWRFFDPTTEAWFLEAHGDQPIAYLASDVSATSGVLAVLAAPDDAAYKMGHVRTSGLLLKWTDQNDAPSLELPAQHVIPQSGGLVLQITGAIPPDGVPDASDELTFRVAVRVAGARYWVDLADYGGWRAPEVVNPTGAGLAADPATRTTAVLSTISIPIADFGPEVADAAELEAVEFDLAFSQSAGRLFLAAVAITGWNGETLP